MRVWCVEKHAYVRKMCVCMYVSICHICIP